MRYILAITLMAFSFLSSSNFTRATDFSEFGDYKNMKEHDIPKAQSPDPEVITHFLSAEDRIPEPKLLPTNDVGPAPGPAAQAAVKPAVSKTLPRKTVANTRAYHPRTVVQLPAQHSIAQSSVRGQRVNGQRVVSASARQTARNYSTMNKNKKRANKKFKHGYAYSKNRVLSDPFNTYQ